METSPLTISSFLELHPYTRALIIDLLMRSVSSRQDIILEAVRVHDDPWSHGVNNRLLSGVWILQSRYQDRTIIKNYDDRQPLPYRPF